MILTTLAFSLALQTASPVAAPVAPPKAPAAAPVLLGAETLFAGKFCSNVNKLEDVFENLYDFKEAPDGDPNGMPQKVKNKSFVPFETQWKNISKYPKLAQFATPSVVKDIKDAQDALNLLKNAPKASKDAAKDATKDAAKGAGKDAAKEAMKEAAPAAFSADRYAYITTTTKNYQEGCWLPAIEALGAFLVGGGKVKLTKTNSDIVIDAKKMMSADNPEEEYSPYKRWDFSSARVQWKDEAKGIPAIAIFVEESITEERGIYHSRTNHVVFFDDKGQANRVVSISSDPEIKKDEAYQTYHVYNFERMPDGRILKYQSVAFSFGKGQDEMGEYNEYNSFYRQEMIIE